MRRGRPSDDYPVDEFRRLILGFFAERALSLRVLESLSGINRGTLSGVLNGKRPCEREDRAAIMRALGIAPEVQTRFLSLTSDDAPRHELILLDGRVSAHPHLQRAQILMSQAQFGSAYQGFRAVFDGAGARGDTLLQADAAAWLGWFHGELERFNDALGWADTSIRLVERHLGMNVPGIIACVHPSQGVAAGPDVALEVLSRALRIRGKILAVRIVHHTELTWLPQAKITFDRSLQLEERLQLPEIGHDLSGSGRYMTLFEVAKKS
jgi:hypothetical protein